MSSRSIVGACFAVLGLAFLVPSAGLLVFEPRMGFESAADYMNLELARAAYAGVLWRLGDVCEIVYALALIGIAAGLSGWPRASDSLPARMAIAAAVVAAGLFATVGMIGIASAPAAAGVGAQDAALSDPALASALVLRAAFRAGSVFMMGAFLAAFLAASATRRLIHPVLAALGLIPAAASLAFPWIMLPVPIALALWCLATGVALLAFKDAAAHADVVRRM